MDFPAEMTRITAHKTPRHQLFQPGFNPTNSCWLEGEWITLPKALWKAKKAAHEKMYKDVKRQAAKQDHHGKRTALKDMTPAQRQAYEFFAGEGVLYGAVPDGDVQPVRVRLAGDRVEDKCLAWLREKFPEMRFPKLIKHGPTGKSQNQLRGMKLPAELIAASDEPYDVTTAIVKKNRARSQEFFNGTVEMIAKGPAGEVTGDVLSFAAMGAFGQLMEQEETIIREEWSRSKGENDGLTDLDEERKVYAEMRAKLKAAVTNFDEWYEQSRKSHNECARANLDNSKGHLFCYVLPKFNEDGTHEPWGEHDVPWAN